MTEMREYHKKEIAFERVLFFSDAVVAIAITLLALDLKIEKPEDQHLSFADLIQPWQKYLAFVLSFIHIAGLWRTHHDFFTYIKKMDAKMMYVNICWLFFIVILPFSTSVLSKHFGDTPAVFLYSANVFILSVLQNFIWDYPAKMGGFISDEHVNEQEQKNIRMILNLDMLNGLIAIVVAFFMPKLAFFLLFFKLPIFIAVAFFFAPKRRRGHVKRGS